MKITCGLTDFSSFASILKKLFLGFTLCMAINIAAQEDGARIYHLEGQSFTLTVHGERRVLRSDALRNGGINLERSGIVHTNPGTFLEIQLLPSGTVIKLSENTSLVYNGIDSNGGFVDLGLLYGRIRIVTGDRMGSGPVVVRSGGVSSMLEAGGLGVDYILEPGDRNAVPRPFFRLHAFSGDVDVFPYGRGGPQPYFGEAQTLSVAEGESLLLDVSSAFTFAEKKPLSHETLNYWTLHDFAGSPPLPMPATGIAIGSPPSEVEPEVDVPAAPVPAEAVVHPVPEAPRRHLPQTINNRAKNTGLALGLVLAFAAVATQGVTYHMYDVHNDRTANIVFNAAYVPLGVGLITALGGLLYNPSSGKR